MYDLYAAPKNGTFVDKRQEKLGNQATAIYVRRVQTCRVVSSIQEQAIVDQKLDVLPCEVLVNMSYLYSGKLTIVAIVQLAQAFDHFHSRPV